MDIHQVERRAALRSRFDCRFKIDNIQALVGEILADLVNNAGLVEAFDVDSRDRSAGLAGEGPLFQGSNEGRDALVLFQLLATVEQP